MFRRFAHPLASIAFAVALATSAGCRSETDRAGKPEIHVPELESSPDAGAALEKAEDGEGRTAPASPEGEEGAASSREASRPSDAEQKDFGEYDSDRSGDITTEEFVRRFRVVPPFEEWDTNADGGLAEPEFISGLYRAWNRNNDARIDAYEFLRGARNWFRAAESYGSIREWDRDGDGSLSASEFRDKAESSTIFERWDEDGNGRIDPDELTYVLYRGWDIDDDGSLDIEEWRTW